MHDLELVRRARQGDREAFRQIVEGHKQKVYALAYGLTGQAEDAEDAVQEVFLKAYKSLDRFRGDARLGSWLYRITVNVCSDQRRRRRPLALVAMGQDEELKAVEERPSADPERRAEADHIRRHLDRAVAQLTPAERSVFLLRQYHELSTREAASILGRAEGTVKNLLFRALRKLRQELRIYDPEAAA